MYFEKLYHLTKDKYLPRIFTEGLNPNNGNYGLTINSKKHDLIFLTDNIDYIKNYQATDEWMKDSTILEVHTSGIPIEQYRIECPKTGDMIDMKHEFVCNRIISIDRIKRLS